MNTDQSKSENQSSNNQSNTMHSEANQSQTHRELVAELLANIASPETIVGDLVLLLSFAVGSSGFTEIHADDRQDLTFRTLELIRTFQAATVAVSTGAAA